MMTSQSKPRTKQMILRPKSFWRWRINTSESQLNGSQMNRERKTWYSNLGKTFISRCILHQHWYIRPIALPVRRKLQHTSLLTVVSATSAPPFQHLRYQRNVCYPVVDRSTRQTLLTANRNYFFMIILCIKSFCLQKTHNRTLLFGSKILMHGRHFDYWNQPPNMRMRVCYLDYHEAELCYYLLIHIENVLRLLQLFYFHLWHIYWLSLVQLLCFWTLSIVLFCI
jgi:hypothetical protein